MVVKTLNDYRNWLDRSKEGLVALWSKVPHEKRENIVYQTAVKLNYSATTIRNYLMRIGTDPETLLEIKETIEEILENNKQ